MPSTVHSFRAPEGVTLGVENFGDGRPLGLLAGGTTMLAWPDAPRATLARGGRYVPARLWRVDITPQASKSARGSMPYHSRITNSRHDAAPGGH